MNFSVDRRDARAASYRKRRALDQFGPSSTARMDVHLDHARVGRDAEVLQSRVARRLVAFEHHRLRRSLRGRLDGGRLERLDAGLGLGLAFPALFARALSLVQRRSRQR
jgi:hypothetical protein